MICYEEEIQVNYAGLEIVPCRLRNDMVFTFLTSTVGPDGGSGQLLSHVVLFQE